jgi:hypothetical protein
MASPALSANPLLAEVYQSLRLIEGRLLSAGETARRAGVDNETWTEAGDWLALADRMGAESVFFVEDDPVLVFAALPAVASDRDWLAAYRNAWCLARPQCVFLAAPDELRVYALSTPPTLNIDDPDTPRPLEIIHRVGDVAERLAKFDRALVESGETFAEEVFASDQKADRRLLADVRSATNQLVDTGLSIETAHALIERILLVRYLEHRGVITPDYLARVARHRPEWQAALTSVHATPILNVSGAGLETVLTNRDFTFALFSHLATDFNGDLFVVSDTENAEVNQQHLNTVRGMLLGETNPNQPALFLWAYDFSIVPTGLISSIYEQFFHSAVGDDDTSTHYTPTELVHFVVNQVLTPNVLAAGPRVLDPACGSGIFLVEAFRAMVRYESARRQRRLSARELRAILLTRIAGIDINAAAIRLAAFSLYLALLNYQRPQDIMEAGPLPSLIWRSDAEVGGSVLLVADAFSDLDSLSVSSGWRKDTNGWRLGFDVVLGNPPWGEPRGRAPRQMDRWVSANALSVGDRSPSQAFIWRAFSLLRAGGVAGLLVHAGIIANTRTRSREFRRQFLKSARIMKLINFSSVRAVFFAGANAPFLFLCYEATKPTEDSWFPYLTVRRSPALENTTALALGRLDRRVIRQSDLLLHDYLWKTYAWGSHRDAALLSRLGLETSLGNILDALEVTPGAGWQHGRHASPEFLRGIPVLNVKQMNSRGALDPAWLSTPAPASVAFPTRAELYHGQRIIVSRRAYVGEGPRARLESQPFSFRHTAYGIPLQELPTWQARIILGILLSSVGQYCLFMRSGRWGAWHDEVTEDDLLAMPVRFPGSGVDPTTRRIVKVINALQREETPDRRMRHVLDGASYDPLLSELNDAVYELFGLTSAERDLIEDFWWAQGDLAASRPKRDGLEVRLNGTYGWSSKLPVSQVHGDFDAYLEVFLAAWHDQMQPGGRLAWRVERVNDPPILCLICHTEEAASPLRPPPAEQGWEQALRNIESILDRRVTRELYIQGTVRIVSDLQIMVVKRNERRLWSRSAAREDFEATLLQAMNLQGS